MNPRRIAVTGATGFLGRYVGRALERRGLEAVGVSRTVPCADLSYTRHVAMDIAAPPPDAYERLGCPELIIDLGWGGLPHYSSAHHIEHEGPAHLRFVRQLAHAGTHRFVVAGTCMEYGMQQGELNEAMETRPTTAYACAKDMLHRELVALGRSGHFSLVWGRVFYVWGEGQGRSALFSQLQEAVRSGVAEFPMSAGTQLRDYLHASEVARLIVALALAKGEPGVVNICSGRPVSVIELVEGWIRDHAWKIEPARGRYPMPAHEPESFWGSRAKLEQVLGAEGFQQ